MGTIECEAKFEEAVSSGAKSLDLSDDEFDTEEDAEALLARIVEHTSFEVLRLATVDVSMGCVSLPEKLFEMPKLRALSIDGCIDCLPPEIKNLQSLEVLALSAYAHEPYPYEIYDLENLEVLVFDEIPQEHDNKPIYGEVEGKHIGKLRGLKVLGITNSTVYDLPEQLCQLTNLQELSLYQTVSLESCPDDIGMLTNLRKVDLRGVPIADKIKTALAANKDIEFDTREVSWWES